MRGDIRDNPGFLLEGEDFVLIFVQQVQRQVTRPQVLSGLMLLDVMMPGMDHVPVIFLTAKVRQDEIEEFDWLGAVEVIPKPFDLLALTEQIQMIEGRYHS
jgi:CheY-like chemotaxis protein